MHRREIGMTLDVRISDTWREAGLRLKIRVVAPFAFQLPDGSTVDVEAFLPDFGGPQGAVVVPLADETRGKRATAGPYFVSLVADSYCRYDEQLFRQTLDDWGWLGAALARPAW